MKKRNLNDLKLKKEIISKPISKKIKGGSAGCGPGNIQIEEPLPSFDLECYWSKGSEDITNLC
ncbi:hypothetical protein GCM10011344_46140 [Dokdonia pacifica]|uniref:Uncharacterized protein n=1 Tax=Dokdonia pacifica TaxID=1627892 RepID=A0A239DBJ3_9FLAO|nr:hypothetical protein [Dokdonia pacifica]GGG40044.1 hypothetical protein GCM10011344_46140 [Dokdonia pacifica]SNS29735.1 hypothetical protein SAMN06265376_11088 [Dokdonia pacifica]